MMRVCDYIPRYMLSLGVDHVFLVTGGGAMFLNDGVASTPGMHPVCNHHEQASAMGAVSWAKYTEKPGFAMLTTGCGGTNGITGLLNGWQDNVACLFVSGQTKRKETIQNSGLALRQFGVQEADIVPVVTPLTKYAVMLNDPGMVAYELEKALYIASSGRPGPVWIDIPMDVQGAQIDETSLRHFSPAEIPEIKTAAEPSEIESIIQALKAARRPMIIAGNGVRLSKGISEFRALVEKTGLPYVASRLGIDLLPGKHPSFIGRIGNKGDRAGNFSVQNADLVLAIGSRLSVSSTGHEYKTFAREAKIIVVDIDPVEHKKNTVRIDQFIQADARKLLQGLQQGLEGYRAPADWLATCHRWKEIWPVFLDEYRKQQGGVNMYHFTDVLSKLLPDNGVIVSDAGSSFYVASQGVMLRDGQRYITSGGQAEMGYTLPASIGIAFAAGGAEVAGITGDGSFQMNIQELQTLVQYQVPVKLFVWNNDGYLSIRATQGKFFKGRFIGTDKESGVSFPEVRKIAEAYGLPFVKISDPAELEDKVREVLSMKGPVVCEVITPRDQEIVPTVSSMRKDDGTMVSKPIEDMYPFLPRDVFLQEMIVRPLDE